MKRCKGGANGGLDRDTVYGRSGVALPSRDAPLDRPIRQAKLFDREADRWNGLYDESGHERWAVFQKQAGRRTCRRQELSLGLLDPHPAQFILDIGCGGGRLGLAIERRGACCVGLDTSMGMLLRAVQLHCGHGLPARFVRADAFTLPFKDERFDAVVCIGVINYYRRREVARLLSELARVLQRGGRFIVTSAYFDPVNWLRSRSYGLLPRPLAIPGPIYTLPQQLFRLLLTRAGLTIQRSITVKKYRFFRHYELYLVEKCHESTS